MEPTLKYKFFDVIHECESDSGKTQVYCVQGRSGMLGIIQWYGPWRAYCFHPNDDTVWSVGCLNDINAAIKAITERRKVIAAHADGGAK